MHNITPYQFTQLSQPAQKDKLYSKDQTVQDFEFNADVVVRFPDMIGRSVPGYWDLIDWIGVLAQNWMDQEAIYDLGTSLGAVSWSIYTKQCKEKINPPPIYAVDSSVAMLQTFNVNLNALPHKTPIKTIHADIRDLQLLKSSLVCLNFTLQFIPLEDRMSVLTKIRKALTPNGALILSEKITGATPDEENRIRQWHHQFKHDQGYSWLEIEQKAKAIHKVMPTLTIKEHKEHLHDAGFSKVTLWNRSFSFVSFVAEP